MAAHIDSLSNHEVSPGQTVYATGAGFVGVTGIQVGDAWSDNLHVDGTETASFAVPQQPDGLTAWVVVHLADGTSSPCEGDAQLVTYRSTVLDAPPGTLTLTELTPDTLTLGRADTYWLSGSGLSLTSAVIVGNHAAQYETYDDTRMMLHVPAVEGPEGGTIELTVVAGGHTEVMQVPCTAGEAAPLHHYQGPLLTSIEPQTMTAEGGQLTIHGADLDYVHTVCIGVTLTAPPDSTSYDTLVVTVPSLADYVGQSLGIEVIDPSASSGTGSAHTITVTS